MTFIMFNENKYEHYKSSLSLFMPSCKSQFSFGFVGLLLEHEMNLLLVVIMTGSHCNKSRK